MCKGILILVIFLSAIPLSTGYFSSPRDHSTVLPFSNQERDQLYWQATELLKSGRFEQAAAEFKKIIMKWPAFYQAYSLLGVAYTQLGKLEEAGKYFLKAVELNPNSPEARNNLGANYLALKKFSEAATEFRKVTAISPENVSAWYNLGTSELQLDHAERAATAFERAAALAPGDAQILIGLSDAQFKTGKPELALTVVHQVGEIAKSDAMTLLTLGVLLERNGQSGEANAYFQCALKVDPNVSERIMMLAGNSINEGDYKTALALLTSLKGSMENSAAWHGMLGYSHFKLGQIEPAMEHLQKAIRLDPTNEDYYLDLGELLGQNNALLANVAVFEAGIKVLPNSIKVRLALAVAHLLTGNLARVEREINTVIARQQDSEIAYKVLLESFEKGMEWIKMRASAERLRQLNKANPLGWYYGAMPEYETGLRNKSSLEPALKLIQKALELDSSEWRSYFLLGKILIAQDRDHEAIPALQKTIQLHSEHPQPYYVLARALQRVGRDKESMDAMKGYREVKSRMESRQFRRLLVDVR